MNDVRTVDRRWPTFITEQLRPGKSGVSGNLLPLVCHAPETNQRTGEMLHAQQRCAVMRGGGARSRTIPFQLLKGSLATWRLVSPTGSR
jgi:hypothetical protein